jgi:ribosome-binding ATPase
VAIAPYPFVTIKPNTGIGYVRVECVDADFGVQCNPREGMCVNHTRFVPVQLIDVAGLVPGAHEGKGMGNQFLDDLRQADVLIHVVDCSGGTNERGELCTPGSHDPALDIRFLEHELDMWYLQIIKRGWERFARQVMQEQKQIDRALGKQLSGLKVTEDMVKEAIAKLNLNKDKPTDWTEEDLLKIATFLRIRTKPMIIACNKIDVSVAADNFERLKKEFPKHMLVPCSAESELALKEASKHGLIRYTPGGSGFEIIEPGKLNDKQQKGLSFIQAMLDRFGSSGVQQTVDEAVWNLLGYIAIFPGGVGKLQDADGNVLPDCFLMPPNSSAIDFAYRLHSDFGDNFIKAVDVKTKLPVGKDHRLKHRDVIEIFARK